MNYKIGTRVMGIKKFEGKSSIIGTLGTIISQLDDDLYCIEYDKDVGGHNGGSRDINTHKRVRGKEYHCWNTRVGYFKLYDKNKRLE
jgi:hypothetical protein